MKTFSATILTNCPEFALENAVALPGWSHADGSGWQKIRVGWYPFEEWSRKIYLRAKHRTDAAKQLDRAGLHTRDLDGGR